MKRILIAAFTTLSGVVLLFSYRTSTAAVVPEAAGSAARSGEAGGGQLQGASDPSADAALGASGSGASPTPSSGGGADSSAGTAGSLQDGTYTGTAVSTRFGPVQVRITVSGGSIADATAIEYPTSNRRDQQINDQAIPWLESEAVAAQSADIDMISGATFTSRGYIGSLQDAIDQARA